MSNTETRNYLQGHPGKNARRLVTDCASGCDSRGSGSGGFAGPKSGGVCDARSVRRGPIKSARDCGGAAAGGRQQGRARLAATRRCPPSGDGRIGVRGVASAPRIRARGLGQGGKGGHISLCSVLATGGRDLRRGGGARSALTPEMPAWAPRTGCPGGLAAVPGRGHSRRCGTDPDAHAGACCNGKDGRDAARRTESGPP